MHSLRHMVQPLTSGAIHKLIQVPLSLKNVASISKYLLICRESSRPFRCLHTDTKDELLLAVHAAKTAPAPASPRLLVLPAGGLGTSAAAKGIAKPAATAPADLQLLWMLKQMSCMRGMLKEALEEDAWVQRELEEFRKSLPSISTTLKATCTLLKAINAAMK